MQRKAFPFWRFALRIYGRTGVAPACLALQDECGADVNLLLYCCWMGRRGKRLSRGDTRSAMTAIARWQDEVVAPLRQARRAIRNDPRGTAAAWAKYLRGRISAAELDAEYVEQLILANAAAHIATPEGNDQPREAAVANLHNYFARLGAAVNPRRARLLETLVGGASLLGPPNVKQTPW